MTLKNKDLLGSHKASLFFAIAIALWIWYWFGTRNRNHYQDTGLYSQIFTLVQTGQWLTLPEDAKEWLWSWFEYIFIYNSDLRHWYLGVAAFYIGGMVAAAIIWMPKHALIACAFIIVDFNFFSYGTNGIRNGMAAGIALFAISIISTNICQNKILSYSIGFILLYLSTAVHQTIFLPLAACILSCFYKNTRVYMIVWALCIILSLIIPGILQSLFGLFIDDARFQSYASNTDEMNLFSKTGFRWDFLLYSSVPITLGWYVIFRKRIINPTYAFLLNIYIITNSFWVCVNSIPYSNRFAYLSWFMMPILICYPLVKFQLFKQQGLVTGLFLFGFTVFALII